MQLYLDLDGTIANFEKKALQVFGMTAREFELQYGTKQFWKTIATTPDFFYELEMMEDGQELYDATKHLKPIVLTGVPQGKFAQEQKKRWVAKYLHTEQPVICCLSREKFKYCRPKDILVDDFIKYKHLWEQAQGHFVLHTSAQTSIEELKNLGVL